MINKGVFLFSILFVLFSCKKEVNNSSDPVPIPQPAKDTLSAGWSIINLSMSSLNSTDIVFIDTAKGYLIGSTSYSWLFKTVDGGKTWVEVPVATISTSRGAFVNLGISKNRVVMTTTSNRIYSVINDNQLDSVTLTGNPWDVQFVGNDTGYIVSSNGLYRSTDAGSKWDKIFSVTQAPSPYTGLYFRNSSQGWIGIGNYLYSSKGSDVDFTLVSVPSGFQWNSMCAPTSTLVYITSPNGLFKYTVNSSAIQRISLPFNLSGFIDMHFESELIGYITTGNRIMKTTDGGLTWKIEVALMGDVRIIEIDSREGMIWACCSNGKVLKYRP